MWHTRKSKVRYERKSEYLVRVGRRLRVRVRLRLRARIR